jgi:hypothetical protein
VYPGDLTFAGNVQLDCSIRVTGNAYFTSGTNLNLIGCAKIDVGGTFNAPDDGLNVVIDFLGEPNTFGNKFSFASYKGKASGYIGSIRIVNIGGDAPIPTLGGRLGNGEAAIAFNPKGNVDEGNGDLGKPPVVPGFDEKGNRVRVCSQLTCNNPSVCPSPKPGSVCDGPSGAWVVPGPVNAQSLTLSCPIRVQGDLTVLGSITVGGCGRLTVDGIARLSSAQGVSGNRIPGSSHISVNFDLNDYGTPSGESDRITWLQAGRIQGGVSGWSGANIWHDSLTITNQKCGNSFSVLFYRSGAREPPSTCGSAAAVSDTEEDFAAAVSDFDEEGVAVDNEGGDGEYVDNAATEYVDNAEIEYLDNAATDTQNTNTNTNADANANAPTYAYALFVLGVLVLIALVIVQVQIVLIRRARESARI